MIWFYGFLFLLTAVLMVCGFAYAVVLFVNRAYANDQQSNPPEL